MNLEDKKLEISKKIDELELSFQSFFKDTMQLGSICLHALDDIEVNPQIMAEWFRFIAEDEKMKKFTRLMSALQYVEDPKDLDIVNNLQENIIMNNKETNESIPTMEDIVPNNIPQVDIASDIPNQSIEEQTYDQGTAVDFDENIDINSQITR